MNNTPGLGLALSLLLLPALALAQSPQPRMPRSPLEIPVPVAQKLVIEGEWGYPCTLTNQCFPSPPDPPEWVGVEVAAWVGTQKFLGGFTGDAPGHGLFEVTVEVPPQQRGEMVMVEVLAQSLSGHTVRFQAIQGVAGNLLAEAGAGERLGHGGLRPNGLTVLSSALVGLLRDANDGDWRMDEDRFMAVLGQLEPARIMRHGVVLDRILNQQWPGLGEFDPIELIASAEAVEAYLEQLPPGQPPMRLFDSRSFPPYQRPSHAALDMTLLPRSATGTVAFGRRHGLRMRSNDDWMPDWYSLMEHGRRETAKSMFLIGTNDNRPTTVSVVLIEGPASESQRISYDCPGVGTVEARRTSERSHFDLWRMAVAAGMEFVEVQQQVAYTYASFDGSELPCADALPASGFDLSYHLAHRPRVPGRAGVLGRRGSHALQVLNPNPDEDEADSQFIAGVVHLDSGQVEVPGYAGQGQVGVGPDGLLVLSVETLPDAARPGVVEMRFERLRSDGLGAEEWLVTTRLGASTDDHVRALVTPAVRPQPGLRLTPRRLDGAWGSGADLSWPGVDEVATLEFNAVTGQGVARVPGQADVPFSWRLEDGRMLASSFARDSAPGVLLPACPAGAADCREVLRRVWEPLRMGTRGALRRLYVVEEVWIDAGDGLRRLSRMLNFYDAF